MRRTLHSKNSTKAERRFAEILKELHIPFQHRAIITDVEVDFLLPGRVCVEINGHPQMPRKNQRLMEAGYSLLHYENAHVATYRAEIKQSIKQLCHNQMSHE